MDLTILIGRDWPAMCPSRVPLATAHILLSPWREHPHLLCPMLTSRSLPPKTALGSSLEQILPKSVHPLVNYEPLICSIYQCGKTTVYSLEYIQE